MRLRALSLLLGLLLLTVGLQPARTQTRVPVPPSLTAQLDGGGQRQIIVGVRTTFIPEGFLAGPAAVDDQRSAIQTALNVVMAQASGTGVAVGERFDYIPFFTATVDKAGLEAVATMAGVSSIEDVTYDRPSLAQSTPLIGANAAWAAGATGAGWNVAVLDTGFDKTHPFLAGKVVAEACYSTATDDGGGVSLCPGGVPTSTAPGSSVSCDAALAGCDHGTHVAGIAVGSNGSASAPYGVAPGAGLIAIQVFTQFNSTAFCGAGRAPCLLSSEIDQISGLTRVADLAGANNVNQIASVNMSLGGDAYTSAAACDAEEPSRKAAIDNLRSLGIATVISSGNNGYINAIGSPGCISSAISVGATTKTDGALAASYSNRASFLSLLAPGTSIVSSIPGSGYGFKTGTSMAAPHVAGAWAAIKQAAPAASVSDVLAALRGTGTLVTDPHPSSGLTFPRLNVNKARLALLSGGAPNAPGAPVVSGAGNIVNIAWSRPVGGGAATSYTVLARATPAGPLIASLPVGDQLSTATSAPNGRYYVAVRASNLGWPGAESASVAVDVPVLAPLPGAPQSLSVAVAGSSATLTWLAPVAGGLVQAYTIVAAASPGGAPLVTLNAGLATSVPVGGIPPGIYYVRVVASNIGGVGPASNEVLVNVAGPQLPGAPTLNAPSLSGRTVTLSWAPGAGSIPTSYVVSAATTPGGAPMAALPVGSTAVSVSAPPPGTYYVRVTAVNGAGAGPASNEVTVVVF